MAGGRLRGGALPNSDPVHAERAGGERGALRLGGPWPGGRCTTLTLSRRAGGKGNMGPTGRGGAGRTVARWPLPWRLCTPCLTSASASCEPSGRPPAAAYTSSFTPAATMSACAPVAGQGLGPAARPCPPPARPPRARPPALGGRQAAGACTCAVTTAQHCFVGQSTAERALRACAPTGACASHEAHMVAHAKGLDKAAVSFGRGAARAQRRAAPTSGSCGCARACACARARASARKPGGAGAGGRGVRETRGRDGAGGREARAPRRGTGGRAPCAPRRTWPAARPWPARRAGARCPGRRAGARPRGSPRAPRAGPAARRARPHRCRGATRPRGATRRAGLPQPAARSVLRTE